MNCCIAKIVGKWEEQEKVGDCALFCKATCGTSKEAFCCKRTVKYENSGDTWTYTVGMSSKPESKTFSFKPGETFESALLCGGLMTSVIRMEGKGFTETHTMKDGEGKGNVLNITRHVDTNDRMHEDMSCGNAKLEIIYKRV